MFHRRLPFDVRLVRFNVEIRCRIVEFLVFYAAIGNFERLRVPFCQSNEHALGNRRQHNRCTNPPERARDNNQSERGPEIEDRRLPFPAREQTGADERLV